MNVWKTRVASLIAFTCLTALPVVSFAADTPHVHKAHKKHAAKVKKSCSTCEYKEAMDKMHHGMMIGYTGDTDIDFVRGMIPHHQGAVDMAKVELKYGKDEELRYLARWIVQEQTLEIGMMESWVRGRFNPNAPVQDVPETAQFKAAMDKMHCDMMIDYTGDADVDFARGMIPHHRGAVDMAAVELRSGKNPDMNKLADSILVTQTHEIDVMQHWLDEHAPAAPAPVMKHRKKHRHKHAVKPAETEKPKPVPAK